MEYTGRSVKPPHKWKDHQGHFDAVLTDAWYALIFQLTARFISATNHFYEQEQIDPALMPVTADSVSSPAGKGSDSIPVAVELFGKKTFLADSMQFQLEYLLRLATKGVYYIMPTFRGEHPSDRHLNQFFHSEVEIKGGFEDALELAERYVLFVTRAILETLGDKLEDFGIDTDHLTSALNYRNGFPRITFHDACKQFGHTPGFYHTLEDDVQTISSLGEKEILAKMGGICWLTHHPSHLVPFYQRRCKNELQTSYCGDLLCGIGEILGLGERHSNYQSTLEAIHDQEVDADAYTWYLQMKQRYPLNTAGFGLGLERYLLWVLKHDDIRDIPLIQRLKNNYSEP